MRDRWKTEDGHTIKEGDVVWIPVWQSDCPTRMERVTMDWYGIRLGDAAFVDRQKAIEWALNWADKHAESNRQAYEERAKFYTECRHSIATETEE